jgi:hypothetical protein
VTQNIVSIEELNSYITGELFIGDVIVFYDAGASIPKALEEEKSTTNANIEEIKSLKDVASLKV